MYFYDPTTREQRELAPGILAKTFWGEKMLVAVVDLLPGSKLSLHQHMHEQVGIVIAGELQLTIADETQTLHAGAVYIIPGATEHHAIAGPQGAQVMDVFSPVREEYRY